MKKDAVLLCKDVFPQTRFEPTVLFQNSPLSSRTKIVSWHQRDFETVTANIIQVLSTRRLVLLDNRQCVEFKNKHTIIMLYV